MAAHSTCGHQSPVGAKFCVECGTSLALPSCPGCGRETTPAARFCPECGTPLRAAPALDPSEHRKTITALFMDLVGSTALQEHLDPETGRRIMRRYYDVCERVVSSYGGHVEGFAGDGLCATWGVVEVREDDALRAVRAASELVASVADLNGALAEDFGVELLTRTGINTGEVVVSVDRRLVGDVMNTAARLESAAPVGGVLIGEPTWRLVRGHVGAEEAEPVVAKGKAEPVRAFRLVGALQPGAAPRAPFTGRESEMSRLLAAFHSAQETRSCRLVSVIGSPGLGKSRLCAEFVAVARAEGGSVVTGACEAGSVAATWLPVAEVIAQVAGLTDGASDADITAALRDVLGTQPDVERIGAMCAAILGVGSMAAPQETFWAVRKLLEAAAAGQPLVVVLDDLHWAASQLLDLVEYLAEWLRDVPVLLLVLARPELRDIRRALTRPGGPVGDVLDLEPLDDELGRALVRGMLGDVEVPAEVAGAALRATGGNPLFLSELLRMLIDDGTLVRAGGTWRLAEESRIEVPPTVEALLTARLERLGPRERDVVERASVIGRQFYRGAVAVLGERGTVGLDEDLEALRRRELVEPEGTTWVDEEVYRFHHVLIRDAAYRALLKDTRAALHERFADWLDAKLGVLVGEHEEVVAYHLEQAHQCRRELGGRDAATRELGARAAARLASAGRRALARDDVAAAANLLGRAAARLDPGDGHELVALLADRVDALTGDGHVREAGQAVAQLRGHVDTPFDEALAMLAGAQVALLVGESVDAGVLAAAVEELRGHDEHSRLAHGLELAGAVHAAAGRYAEAEHAFTDALAAARAGDDKRRIALVLSRALGAALWGPTPVPRASGRCMDVHRMLGLMGGSAPVEAQTWRAQSQLAAIRGRWDAAESLLGRARASFAELGLGVELALCDLAEARNGLLHGDPETAAVVAERAVGGLDDSGLDSSEARAVLARALMRQGRDDEAVALVGVPDATTPLRIAVLTAAVHAGALQRRGDVAGAVALATATSDRARGTDALLDRAVAAETLADALALAGDESGAAAARAEAARAYREKGGEVREPETPAGTQESVETAMSALVAALTARDFDQVAAIHAPDYVFHDRAGLGWAAVRGPEAAAMVYRSWVDLAPDAAHFWRDLGRVGPYLTGIFGAHGTADDGPVEVAMGLVVDVDEAGRIRSKWATLPTAEAVLAQARETLARDALALDAAAQVLPHHAALVAYRRAIDAANRHDLDALLAGCSPGFLMSDETLMGTDTVGYPGLTEFFGSWWEVVPDAEYQFEALGVVGDAVVVLMRSFGTGPDGSPGEVRQVHAVAADGEGRVRWIHVLDVAGDDVGAALERTAGLDPATGRPTGMVHPVFAAYQRLVAAGNAHEPDLVAACASEDFVMRDESALGWPDAIGREGLREFTLTWLEMAPDASYDATPIGAIGDVGVVRYNGRTDGDDGASAELTTTHAAAVDEDGLIHWITILGVADGDQEAALARAAQLDPATGRTDPAAAAFDRLVAAINARDWLALHDAVTPDCHSDGEPLMGVEPITDAAALADFFRSWMSVAPDAVMFYELIAREGELALVRFGGTSTGADGEPSEVVTFLVAALDPRGRLSRVTGVRVDDRDAARSRLAELAAAHGERPEEPPVVSSYRRFADAFNVRDWEAVRAGARDDLMFTGERQTVRLTFHGPEDWIGMLRSWIEVVPDARMAIQLVGEVDGVAVIRCTGFGTGADGLEAEVRTMHVVEVDEEGRTIRGWALDDDVTAALARAAEIAATIRAAGPPSS